MMCPDTTDTLVIGGGVLGSAAAYYLAVSGIDVLLVEREELNRAASGSNAGTLHIQIPASHFAAYYLAREEWGGDRAAYFAATNRLYAAARVAWRTIEQELRADLGVRLGGGLMVAETPDQFQLLEAKSAYENDVGLETELLSPEQLIRIAPHLSPRLTGASYCASEGFANPLLVGPALVSRAREFGARVHVQTTVRRIDQDRRGRFLVETNKGTVRAQRIVAAAGARTSEVTAMVGLHLPVRSHPLQVMVTEPWPPKLTHLVQHAGRRLSLRQTQYGTFVIGGGWPAVDRTGVHRVPVSRESIVANASVAVDVLPLLHEVRLVRAWGAMTSAGGRANRVGFIGEYQRRPGFYVLVSGGWGFTLAPVLGRLAAELVADGRTSLPIAAFDLDHAAQFI